MTTKEYKFKFSIVSAVYNVEPFIEEMIESIINQDIGFEENVQLILVDDCSKDKSFEICQKYAKLYPNNIVVLQTETNSRQAVARNLGIKKAEGQYINFIDSDDKFDTNTLSEVYNFFEKNDKYVDVVSIPMVFFGGLTGPHPLNNKYAKGTRIIDVDEEPNTIQLSAATAFIKKEVVDEVVCFDKRLYHAEDAKEMLKILDIKRKLGVVSNVNYWYRKHATSTISNIPTTKESYIDYLVYFQEEMVDYFKKKYAVIPKFAQYSLMYDLQGKLKIYQLPENVLTEEEIKIYVEKIKALTLLFDDEVILAQRIIPQETKSYLLANKIFGQRYSEMDNVKYLNNLRKIRLFNRAIVDFIEIEGTNITIRYHINISSFYDVNQISLIVKHNGNVVDIKTDRIVETNIVNTLNIFNSVFGSYTFDCAKDKINDIRFCIGYLDDIYDINNVVYSKHTPINNSLKNSYYLFGKYKMCYYGSSLIVRKKRFLERIRSELKLDLEILKSKNKVKKLKILATRWVYILLNPFMKHKNIWLFADKADKADDNAEALFKYVVNNKETKRHAKYYYVINKKYKDYARMKKYGKVVDYLSLKHYFLNLFAKFKISAHSHMEFINPFRSYEGYFRDISCNSKFVFLQHGVIFGDLSKLLKRTAINPSLFITSTIDEFNSLLDESYGYDKKQVVLTGLSRFDYLYNDNKKIITIAPTWRKDLFLGMDEKTSQRILKDGFENSKYYTALCSLLNSDKLLNCAEQHGYEIHFLPHSVFFPYVDKFNVDNRVKVLSYDNISYREMFAKTSLIITDYSSLVFDFAYLKKPILYYQFDKFEGGYNYNDGYFDFEKDGFGEVVYDNENEMVDLICDYIKSDCKIKDKYLNRINNTFKYTDQNNCKRIYDAIVDIENVNKR